MKTIVLDLLGDVDLESQAVGCIETFLRQRGIEIDISCPNGIVAIISSSAVVPAELDPIATTDAEIANDLANLLTPGSSIDQAELPAPAPAEVTVTLPPTQKRVELCKIWDLSSVETVPCTFDPTLEVSRLCVPHVDVVGDSVMFSYRGSTFKVPLAQESTYFGTNVPPSFTSSSIRVSISLDNLPVLHSCILEVVQDGDEKVCLGKDLAHILIDDNITGEIENGTLSTQ